MIPDDKKKEPPPPPPPPPLKPEPSNFMRSNNKNKEDK
jgi:hypothetical protein